MMAPFLDVAIAEMRDPADTFFVPCEQPLILQDTHGTHRRCLFDAAQHDEAEQES
jgi:hypothetical protein